jgi:regulator of sigma D
MCAVNERESMTDRQFTLEHRLLQLRDEIKTLQAEKELSSEVLSVRLKALLAERFKLEDELINMVVNPENSYRTKRWMV